MFSWTGRLALTLGGSVISSSQLSRIQNSAEMFLLLLALACTVQAQLDNKCLSSQGDAYVPKNPNANKDLLRSQLDFSLSLLKLVSRKQPSDNIFISPLSIYNAMLLAYFASANQTEMSLKKALFLPKNQNKVNMLITYKLQKLNKYLSGSETYQSQVNIANRMFLSKNQTVRDCMEEYFNDDIVKVDFSAKNLGRTVNIINQWIAEQTQNNIQNLVSEDSINPDSQIILANAAYFKGIWKNQFDPRDTRKGDFFVTNKKKVTVPLMFQMNTFNHWRNDKIGAEILELPYEGDQISLLLLLPDPSNSTHPAADLLQRIDSESMLDIVREAADSERNEDKVEVVLPKFSVERTLELTSILESMGVGDLFKPTSDLTGLTGGPRIQLNSAIHKAKIQVDERGTEASAVTIFTDTRMPANGFMCDRPFVYMLYDKNIPNSRTVFSSVLFAGMFNDPSK